jgi:hypothetical protein
MTTRPASTFSISGSLSCDIESLGNHLKWKEITIKTFKTLKGMFGLPVILAPQEGKLEKMGVLKDDRWSGKMG